MAESLILTLPGAALVFGMDWFPLVGTRPLKQGRRIARRHRATHMVCAGDAAAAVGIMALPRARVAGAKPLFSAGQNLARIFPSGTFMMLLELNQDGYWLVAVHGGAVIARTDSVYRTPDEAALMLDELRQAYPHIAMLGEPGAPAPPPLAAIEAASSPHSRLQRVAGWPSVFPWPIQCFLMTLVLALLLPRLWDAFNRPAHGPPAAKPVDARLAWKQAVARSAHQRVVHGSKGYAALLENLYRLPATIGGWKLLRAECAPAGQQWQCHAQYERWRPGANNDTFISGLPEDWQADFISLEQARVAWRAAEFGVPLQGLQLSSATDNDRQLLSRLQSLAPAFTHLNVGTSRPLALVPPADHDGTPVARPPGVPIYLSRALRLAGPLRSGGLLVPMAGPMSWTRAQLSLQAMPVPALKSSRLVLNLEGVLYETDAPTSSPASPDAHDRTVASVVGTDYDRP